MTKIWSVIRTNNMILHDTLQTDLDTLNAWCNTWLLHSIQTNVRSCIMASTSTLHTFSRTTQKSRNWHPRTQKET